MANGADKFSLASHPTPAAKRYLRHSQIDGFSQQAVATCRIIVVGAGAIGNEVIKNLVLLGAGQNENGAIDVYDFDRVELHNLTRSVLLREADVGQNKAACVARRARDLEPAARVNPHDGDIADTLSLADVINTDVIIGCVDNFEARIRLNQLALLAGTPWINAAIDSRYASVEVFPFGAAEQPPCYECGLPEGVYKRLAERRSCGGLLKLAREQQVMPTTTVTASLAGAQAVNQALLLTGCDNRLQASSMTGSVRLFTDGLAGTTSRTELIRASLCACCDALPWRVSLQATASSATDLQALARAHDWPANETITLSDALIARAACTRCGEQPGTGVLTGRRAASVPDSVMICARCGHPSVEVDITDRFTVDALLRLCGDEPLPCQWAELGGHYVSLQSKPSRIRP